MTTPDEDAATPRECSDEPKLTAEEWDYIGQLTDEPGKHAAEEGS